MFYIKRLKYIFEQKIYDFEAKTPKVTYGLQTFY